MRRREILDESLGHIAKQLELVRRRRDEIGKLEEELLAKRKRVRRRSAGSLLLEVLTEHRHLALVVGAEVGAV